MACVRLEALNFALSIRRNVAHLEKQFAVVALDAGAHKEMSQHGFKAFLYSRKTPISSDFIWKFRWQLLLLAVKYELPLAVVDSDVVAFRDPFPFLGRDADMEIATEHFWPDKHLWQGSACRIRVSL